MAMAAELVCVSTEFGIPLFSRVRGDCKQLSFSLIGSLIAVKEYAKSKDFIISKTRANSMAITWKEYSKSITLILVSSQQWNFSNAVEDRFLDLIFTAILMIVGEEDLLNVTSTMVEKLKKDVRGSFIMIDALLDSLNEGSMTYCPEWSYVQERDALQATLDTFTESADSAYGCLMSRGKICAATNKWLSLSEKEMILISLLVNSVDACTAMDLVVFLPTKSPTVPIRLLTISLLEHVSVCVLCDLTPPLGEVLDDACPLWQPSYPLLQTLQSSNFELDAALLGFIYINKETCRCLSTGTHRSLYNFYLSTAGRILPLHNGPKKSDGSLTASETYSVSDQLKYYALDTPSSQLYALYSSDIPTYALRSKTLDVLVKAKIGCG